MKGRKDDRMVRDGGMGKRKEGVRKGEIIHRGSSDGWKGRGSACMRAKGIDR